MSEVEVHESSEFCSALGESEDDNFAGRRDSLQAESQRSLGFLKIALATNTTLIVVQLAFTVVTGSLLLFSDTIDGLIDSFSLVIPLLSVTIAKKCRSDHGPTTACKLEKVTSNTFKLLSVSLMISYRAVVLLNCAIEFTREPELGSALALMIIGAVGFVVNSLTTCCVMKQEQAQTDSEDHDLLISTILHVVSDAIGSLLVFGVGVYFFLSENERIARYADLALTACVSVIMIFIASRLLVKDVAVKLKDH